MCTNKVRFYNRWSHSWQYSDCGHCPSCQQQKAFKRVKRIKNASWNGYVPLFVTLTYANISVPYLDKSDYLKYSDDVNLSSLYIRRDVDFRRIRISGDYEMSYVPFLKVKPIEVVDCFENHIYIDKKTVRDLPDLKGKKGCVGVLYYKDLQNFEKRLRINLQRRYGLSTPIYSFKCSEYGPTTTRPHFHLLIYVPIAHLEECKCAIAEAWPYDYKDCIHRNIELARNAASYVSAYVNRNSDFPKLFETNTFKPKHSFSKGFGTQNLQFTLEHIVEGIGRGSLRYSTTRARDGFREVADVLLPKYFLNRYFFKFRGYSRLSRCAVLELLRNPAILYRKSYEDVIKNQLCCTDEFNEIDWEKVNVIFQSIKLRYSRFCEDFVYREVIDGVERKFVGLPDNQYTCELFADYWYRSLNIYASNLYEDSLKGYELNPNGDILECYYNLEDVRSNLIPTDLKPLIDQHPEISNPNLFHSVIVQTNRMQDIFNATLKRRRVINSVMSQKGIYV